MNENRLRRVLKLRVTPTCINLYYTHTVHCKAVHMTCTSMYVLSKTVCCIIVEI